MRTSRKLSGYFIMSSVKLDNIPWLFLPRGAKLRIKVVRLIHFKKVDME